ncbi:MAG TPA: homocysteine S-methyltransferase family protein, partial [Bacillota bacterium]|nr:homocysteine S-methyltransferase family protein [Bacillota bacterium]
ENREVIFTEGAVLERVSREFKIEVDPHILHAALIYSGEGQKVLHQIYRGYLNLGADSGLPMVILTPTWRANVDRLENSSYRSFDVNGDAVKFLENIRAEYGEYGGSIYIGGLIGCKGDAYKPKEALTSDEAYTFHEYQVKALANAEADFLMAATLPALSEAVGISKVMAETGKDYVISFVIRPEGTLLDGTFIHEAIGTIDSLVKPKPMFYMVNCVHPTVLQNALGCCRNSTDLVRERLIAIQGNTSSLSPEELDESAELQTEEPEIFAAMMKSLYLDHGLRIFGGCCGTDHRHIKSMIAQVINR